MMPCTPVWVHSDDRVVPRIGDGSGNGDPEFGCRRSSSGLRPCRPSWQLGRRPATVPAQAVVVAGTSVVSTYSRMFSDSLMTTPRSSSTRTGTNRCPEIRLTSSRSECSAAVQRLSYGIPSSSRRSATRSQYGQPSSWYRTSDMVYRWVGPAPRKVLPARPQRPHRPDGPERPAGPPT